MRELLPPGLRRGRNLSRGAQSEDGQPGVGRDAREASAGPDAARAVAVARGTHFAEDGAFLVFADEIGDVVGRRREVVYPGILEGWWEVDGSHGGGDA